MLKEIVLSLMFGVGLYATSLGELDEAHPKKLMFNGTSYSISSGKLCMVYKYCGILSGDLKVEGYEVAMGKDSKGTPVLRSLIYTMPEYFHPLEQQDEIGRVLNYADNIAGNGDGHISADELARTQIGLIKVLFGKNQQELLEEAKKNK